MLANDLLAPAGLREIATYAYAIGANTRLVVGELAPCDLLLFNRTPAAWGAHVAVHLGSELAIHLSQRAGVPVIWRIEDFSSRPEYACFIGAKRIRRAGDR